MTKRTAENTIGRMFRDKVTDFEGVAVSYVSYLTSCDAAGLQPKMDKGVVPEVRYVDVTRLVELDVAPIVIDLGDERPGNDRYATPGRSL